MCETFFKVWNSLLILTTYLELEFINIGDFAIVHPSSKLTEILL